MQWKNSAEEYGVIAKFLHWVMALAIIFMLALGIYMADLPFSADKLELYGIHKAVGSLILMAVGLRLAWRFINLVPPLPAAMPGWEKLAAHAGHFGLYGLMFAMPLTGWLLSSAAGFPVSVFGWFTLPNLIAPNPALRELFGEAHELLAFGLIGLIAAHAGAALKHHFIEKDNVLRRMLPALLLLLPLAAQAEAPLWQVEKAKSTIGFTAVQNHAPVEGSFTDYDAVIHFDPANLAESSARVTIRLASITASYGDVASTLQTPDWFNTAAFPEAVFEASAFTHTGGSSYTAEGTLKLRDKTQPVTLRFTLDEYGEHAAKVSGEALLSRGAFGVGQGEWEKNEAVKDEVKVTFTLTATR